MTRRRNRNHIEPFIVSFSTLPLRKNSSDEAYSGVIIQRLRRRVMPGRRDRERCGSGIARRRVAARTLCRDKENLWRSKLATWGEIRSPFAEITRAVGAQKWPCGTRSERSSLPGRRRRRGRRRGRCVFALYLELSSLISSTKGTSKSGTVAKVCCRLFAYVNRTNRVQKSVSNDRYM